MEKLLDNINTPEDLRKLQVSQLPQLCSELRSYMIEVCSEHPRHLGSSLFAVKMITPLPYVYYLPRHNVVFHAGN